MTPQSQKKLEIFNRKQQRKIKVEKEIKRVLNRKNKIEIRKNKIIALVKIGLPFTEISVRFKITRQRVQQLAKTVEFSRWKNTRITNKITYEKIMVDFNNGASITEILEKYKLTKDKLGHLYRGQAIDGDTLNNKYKVKRNNKIVNDFINGNTASAIINNTDKILDDPIKITSRFGVYQINRKHGVKRYPQIGNRSDGCSFEKKRILKFIVDKHDRKKNPLSFREIADELNRLGYKTITGIPFKTPNVNNKYNAIKNELIN